MEALNQIDTRLFLFLNGLHNETFDSIMIWISGKTTWWPFYLLLLGYLAWTKCLQLIPTLVFVVLTVTLADQVSVHFFKDVFERLRPCHEPEISGLVHIVNDRCGGQYGFVSSHAANAFGVAFFLTMVVRKRWFTVVMFSWAAIVGYSRIYLGVHYPGDVVGGALLGVLCGYLVYLLNIWVVGMLPGSWKMGDPMEQSA
ncbi:MAG: phosphatase PAP2 family protein [Bacteroidales bacterium]|nr:phosphatase PAP2 family protein [Bacteroidales bacterium]